MRTTFIRSRDGRISIKAIILILFSVFGSVACSRITDEPVASRAVQDNFLAGIPLRFIENVGQTLPGVLYHVEGAGHTVLFESGRVVFNRKDGNKNADSPEQIILEFPGSNLAAEIDGINKQNGVTNYYRGNNPTEWYTNISSYGSLIYEELYPGIDMICSGEEGSLKNEFHVAPGADPKQIQMVYSGVRSVKVSGEGTLLISTGSGILEDAAPVAYQMVNGERKDIRVYYRIRSGVVNFRLGSYFKEIPLVIDPEFSYVTYYGGNDNTTGAGVAFDKDGYLLFAGYSEATDLLMTNAEQDANAGWEDAFVVKIDTATGDYIYATYIGGDTSDIVRDFAIDDKGNAYIAGSTHSPDFPVSDMAYQKIPEGYQEAFLTKIGPDGTVIYSTLLGGTSRDYAYGLALNKQEEVYLTGYTISSDFPVYNALQTIPGGNYDAFIAKISASGDSLLYSSYLGGSEYDGGRSIALDMDGNIYITGDTRSADFPLANAAQETLNGSSDAFVSKLNSSAQAIVYSTFLGGAENELAYDLVVDTAGIAYVCGASESADFPLKSLGFPASMKGASEVPETGVDAFITFYDVVGQVIFASMLGLPAFNYFRAMTIMSGGIFPYLFVTGFQSTGLSVTAYAIRDYSEIIEHYEAVPLFEINDTSQHYYPRDIFALSESGAFALNLSSTVTIPTRENETADPHPEHESIADNLIFLSKPAQIKVTIAMPDSIQYQSKLVTYIRVKNVSSDVEAKEVQLTIHADTTSNMKQLEEFDDPFLNEPFMLGNIPPGDSVEIILAFRTTSVSYWELSKPIIEIEAAAGGVNTNFDVAKKSTKPFTLKVHFAVVIHKIWGQTKSTRTEVVDLYLNDKLLVDDLENGVPQEVDASVAGIYPKIDITRGDAENNLDPIASPVIDLNGSGNEHLISPANHQLILIEDPEEAIHLYHKRDVQSLSSDPAMVDLYLVHGGGDIGSADIRIVDVQNHETVLETLFDDLKPDSVTDYISLTPGVVAFELGSSDNSVIYDVSEVDLSSLKGKAIHFVIVPEPSDDGLSARLIIPEMATTGIPEAFSFSSARVRSLISYPNPFSSSVTIEYLLEQSMDMELTVHNAAGQKIRTLHSGFLLEGRHWIYWDGTLDTGRRVDPGIYLCLLRTESGIIGRKLINVR